MDDRLVQSLPDWPLEPSDLESLDDHDRLEVLAAEGEMPSPAAEGLAVETENWYYVLGYDEDRGWYVFERLSESLSDGRDRIEAAFDEWVDDEDPVTTDRPF